MRNKITLGQPSSFPFKYKFAWIMKKKICSFFLLSLAKQGSLTTAKTVSGPYKLICHKNGNYM